MSNIVGERILRNFEFLNKLCKTKSLKNRWILVQRATRDELLSLVEICSNILSSDFILTKSQKKKILPYADFIRQLSRARSEKRVKNIIRNGLETEIDKKRNQKGQGSFLPSLLVPILIEAARFIVDRLNKK